MRVILHVITSLDGGGAEAVLSRLVAADRSHRHYVASLMHGDGRPLAVAGACIQTLDMPAGMVTPRGLWRLGKLIQELQPDVVQTWMYHADLVGGVLTRLLSTRPVLWGLRNAYLESGTTSMRTRLVARLCARLSHRIPTAIVSCSAVGAQLHVRRGYAREKMRIIANGYDYRTLRRDANAGERLRRAYAIPPDAFLFGMVARWDPQKDHVNLCAALAALQRIEQSNWRCLLVGQGISPDNGALTRLLHEQGVRERVVLCGPRPDVVEIMSALDAHVLSSAGEAFPNVVGEAMSCGTPCIVTDVGDAAFLLGDTGWVVPPRQPVQLAAAMAGALRELADPRRRSQRQIAARQRIIREFNLEKMVNEFRAAWAAAIAEKPLPYSAQVVV